MKRNLALLISTIAACAAISGPGLLAQSGEPSYSPEGAWFAWATIAGVPHPVPFMDIYTSDSNNRGRSGTVLCTLSIGKFPGPTGSFVGATASAHGNWVRLEKNRFAFTAWRILVNDAGQPVGTAKFWGTLTAETSDTFTGTMNTAYYYGQSAIPFATFTGTTAGKRIAIEIEQP